jgi:S-adenosylmethionine:tRNA ribosyltransferase-isomerase
MIEENTIPADYRAASFEYTLPRALIAQRPSERRDESRLLFLPAEGACNHGTFKDILDRLRPGDLLVANDGRVLRARFHPQRAQGGKAEVLLLHPAVEPGCWEAMARPGKRIRKGDRLMLDADCGIEIVDWAHGGNRIIRFFGITADAAMAQFGVLPLPPYIDRPPADADERYQTVYARRDGSVAAPTAGLHFTPELLTALRERGIGWATITLHVGAGTFRPVKTDDIREHVMHAELYEIGEEAASAIAQARTNGGRIVAVGTTVLRALEAAARESDGSIEAGARWTSIFIHAPYEFRVVDALLTNFHLPRSTLLMLVAAFAGRERVLAAYEEAVRREYRFYSFGDAMFLERPTPSLRTG